MDIRFYIHSTDLIHEVDENKKPFNFSFSNVICFFCLKRRNVNNMIFRNLERFVERICSFEYFLVKFLEMERIKKVLVNEHNKEGLNFDKLYYHDYFGFK